MTTSRLIVVASPQCVLDYGMPENVQGLNDYPCLLFSGKDGCGIWPLTGPEGETFARVNARLTINGMGALIASAKAGLGAALVPEILVAKEIASGKLIRFFPNYCYESGIFAVYSSRRNQTAALRVFLDFVIQQSEAENSVIPTSI